MSIPLMTLCSTDLLLFCLNIGISYWISLCDDLTFQRLHNLQLLWKLEMARSRLTVTVAQV